MRCDCKGCYSLFSQQVLTTQAINASKFAQVTCNQFCADVTGMSRNQYIVRSNDLTLFPQIIFDIGCMSGGGIIKFQDGETGNEFRR
jgi:hypothetical protein